MNKIKSMFKDFQGLTGPMKRELGNMGFKFTEEGKHYKMQLEGQEGTGVFVSISKTPSDYRSGKNTASKIISTFF